MTGTTTVLFACTVFSSVAILFSLLFATFMYNDLYDFHSEVEGELSGFQGIYNDAWFRMAKAGSAKFSPSTRFYEMDRIFKRSSDRCGCGEKASGCPRGPPGPPGEPGEDGSNGQPGPDGQNGHTPTDEYGGSRDNSVSCPAGPQGLQGPDGAPGVPGKDGQPGLDGQPGDEGPTGPRGAPGNRGRDGNPGSDGNQGRPGRDGTRGVGQPGAPGQQGSRGQEGPRGFPGNSGTPGEQGYAGPPGQPGNDGEQGPDGIGGIPGEPGLPGSDAAYCTCPERTSTTEPTSTGGYKIRRRLVKHIN